MTNALLRFEHPLRKPFHNAFMSKDSLGLPNNWCVNFTGVGLSPDGVDKCYPVCVFCGFMIALIIFHLGRCRGASQYGPACNFWEVLHIPSLLMAAGVMGSIHRC